MSKVIDLHNPFADVPSLGFNSSPAASPELMADTLAVS